MKKLPVLVVFLVLVGTASWATPTVTGRWLHECWLADQKLTADPTIADKTATARTYVYMGFLILARWTSWSQPIGLILEGSARMDCKRSPAVSLESIWMTTRINGTSTL